MSKKRLLVFCMVIMTALSGCNKEQPENTVVASSEVKKAEKEIFSMDTYMTLTCYGENADEAVNQSEIRIEELNDLLSTGLETSEVYNVNKNNGGFLSKDAAYLLEKSIELNKLTDGLFDISIYPLMEKWGFTDKNFNVPSDEEINTLLPLVNTKNINFDKDTSTVSFNTDGMKIDFGGIAKGYVSSEIMKIYKNLDIEYGIVNLGGNVHTYGQKPGGKNWKIGIQNPDKTKDFLGILESSNKAVISSGDYERYFIENDIKYHHILDPFTGKPSNKGLSSVTVICSDGTIADGLSTSLFLMGKDDAVKFWYENSNLFDMILFTSDENLYITEGIENDFSSDLYDINIIRN